MIIEFIRAYFFIFIAEMADKSQILAMIFATKYKIRYVLFGVFFGAALNHGLAVMVGAYLGDIIPLNFISIIAGALFVLFGLWSLRLEEDEDDNVKVGKFSPIVTVMLAFFLGEIGDKTQVTAITLATQATNPFVTWMGTVSGMVTTGAIGIWVGRKFGKKIPELLMKCLSAIVFIFFGSLKLFESIPRVYTTIPKLAFYFIVVGYISYRMILKNIHVDKQSKYKNAAEELYKYTHQVKVVMEDICIGCSTCQDSNCVVGRAKAIIKLALENKDITELIKDPTALQLKDFDKKKVILGLADTIKAIHAVQHMKHDDRILHVVRQSLETILFDRCIDYKGDMNEYVNTIEKYDKAISDQVKILIELKYAKE